MINQILDTETDVTWLTKVPLPSSRNLFHSSGERRLSAPAAVASGPPATRPIFPKVPFTLISVSLDCNDFVGEFSKKDFYASPSSFGWENNLYHLTRRPALPDTEKPLAPRLTAAAAPLGVTPRQVRKAAAGSD